MTAEETRITRSLNNLENIDKLKGTSNYQTWKLAFEDELRLLKLWRYIDRDHVKPMVSDTVTEAQVETWTQAQDQICTMMKTRCERNPRAKIKNLTTAKQCWDTLAEFKPRGSGILNSTYKRLDNLTLAACDNDPQTYADKFMEILEEFDNLSSVLDFDETYKIYRFHSGLGSLYNSYCE